MPTVISRDEALARIRAEGGSPPCLMCAVRDRTVGPTYAVYEYADILVLLPRYVRRWGHIVVMPQAHVTTYAGIEHSSYFTSGDRTIVTVTPRSSVISIAMPASPATSVRAASAAVPVTSTPSTAVITFRDGYYVDTVLNGNGCLYATTAHDVSYWDYSTDFRCCAS